MRRCEVTRLGAIACLVSCLPQRVLHGNAKTFDVIFKKMGEESTRAVELALGGGGGVIVCLFLVRNRILNLNSPQNS